MTCRRYFPKGEMLLIGTGNNVCSTDCMSILWEKRNRPRPKKKPVTAQRNDIPPVVRKEVIRRDGGKCRYCSRNHELHLHHIEYRSQGGRSVPHNLITLCHKCHELVHSDKRRFQPLLRGVIWRQYVDGRYVTVPSFERWYANLIGANTEDRSD